MAKRRYERVLLSLRRMLVKLRLIFKLHLIFKLKQRAQNTRHTRSGKVVANGISGLAALVHTRQQGIGDQL